MRVGYLPPIERERFLPARRLRRMGTSAQIWTIASLLARADAFGERVAPMPPPERRGMSVGTAFGGVDTTWEYVSGLLRDGLPAANPFLFSESVANAPAGHAAIELDTRGGSVTFTCAEVSAATAVDWAARAIAEDRLDLAYAGGVDLMPEPLLRILAALRGPCFVGEGAVCLVLESLSSARGRGARIHAEVAGSGLAADPSASAHGYGRDPRPLEAALGTARERLESIARAGRGGTAIRKILFQACGDPEAEAAERSAAGRIVPEAGRECVSTCFGAFAAGGGLGLAAAVLDLADRPETGPPAGVLVSGHAGGGGIVALGFLPPPGADPTDDPDRA
jgi:3-oxoacyl-[acyl-carrier-protein] synthase II